MSYRIALTLLFVSLAFVLIGCPGDPPPPQNVTITLGEIVSEPKQVELERYPQNNCGGTSETDYEVGRSHVIVRELEVGTGFEVNTKGEVSVLGTGVALGAAVSGQVGSTYGTQDSLERAVTVRAAPGTKMEHEISHQEIWKVGTATIVVNGQRVDIPFSYRHEFTLVLLDSRQLRCDHTPTPAVTYTAIPTIDDPVLMPPADTPTPTNTRIPPPPAETTSSCGDSQNSLGVSLLPPAVFTSANLNEMRVFSHCPRSGLIRYEQIAVDDELAKVLKVCGSTTEDVTLQFEPYRIGGDVLQQYRSHSITLEPGCRIDFYVRDLYGVKLGLHIREVGTFE